MIDGLYPSQIHGAEEMRNSHYRNLERIINHRKSQPDKYSPDILKISRHRKMNHDNWRIFNRNQYEKSMHNRNTTIYHRLSKIAHQKSRYSRVKTEEPEDGTLHHNYMYECQRRYQKINKSNCMIVEKIENIKPNFSCSKQLEEYKANRLTVIRLQKFARHKRLERIVSKSSFMTKRSQMPFGPKKVREISFNETSKSRVSSYRNGSQSNNALRNKFKTNPETSEFQ